ncbi:pyrBI operon leader peptide [Escherichia coli]|nr:pyrBI operon leader peptide [Escherichia coli]
MLGGSIVKRVRYNVSPRLKSDTGLVFYSRCLIYSLGPSFEGLFFARHQEINMNPFYQKINVPSREVLELVLKIAAKIENHSSTIAAFVCTADDARPKNASR